MQWLLVYLELCNHHHNLISEHFYHPRKKPQAIRQSLPYPKARPWQPLIYFLSLWACLFWTFHINGIIQDVVICDWILSLRVFSRLIHIVACVSASFNFFLPNNTSFLSYTTFGHHSSVDGHLGCSHFLPNRNDAAMNIPV